MVPSACEIQHPLFVKSESERAFHIKEAHESYWVESLFRSLNVVPDDTRNLFSIHMTSVVLWPYIGMQGFFFFLSFWRTISFPSLSPHCSHWPLPHLWNQLGFLLLFLTFHKFCSHLSNGWNPRWGTWPPGWENQPLILSCIKPLKHTQPLFTAQPSFLPSVFRSPPSIPQSSWETLKIFFEFIF